MSRKFGEVRPSTHELEIKRAHPRQDHLYHAPPPHVAPAPYRLNLSDILSENKMNTIKKANKLVCHVGGDCGGINNPANQQIVAEHMEQDFARDPADHPSFLYMLGDCVYYNGEQSHYYSQFYLPYQYYPGPIFSVPGNHDGALDLGNPDPRGSLASWMDNFCATKPGVLPNYALDIQRDAMTQPGAFWTLVTPYLWFIGLYSNVPEGGEIRAPQASWLASELKAAADAGVPCVVCLHHPVYSGDMYHSGSESMESVLETAVKQSGNRPDAVFTAHVHNYQRFTKSIKEGPRMRDVPYLVVGAMGYPNLHGMAKQLKGKSMPLPIPTEDGLRLDTFVDDRFGYLRLEVSKTYMRGEYMTVPRTQEAWSDPAQVFDSFQLDFNSGTLDVQSGLVATAPRGGINLVRQGFNVRL